MEHFCKALCWISFFIAVCYLWHLVAISNNFDKDNLLLKQEIQTLQSQAIALGYAKKDKGVFIWIEKNKD